jgi:ribonuclease HII
MICGVDEAGRGPLAGPVFAAAVILGDAINIHGLADSKKINKKRREILFSEIKLKAVAWSIASASVQEIDKLNILQASLLAMKRAVLTLRPVPTKILIDGIHAPKIHMECETIIGGDAKIAAISAASILAKVARDAWMIDLHNQFPEYAFNEHKGYGTIKHLNMLQLFGLTSSHRRSFKPVKNLIELNV